MADGFKHPLDILIYLSNDRLLIETLGIGAFLAEVMIIFPEHQGFIVRCPYLTEKSNCTVLCMLQANFKQEIICFLLKSSFKIIFRIPVVLMEKDYFKQNS